MIASGEKTIVVLEGDQTGQELLEVTCFKIPEADCASRAIYESVGDAATLTPAAWLHANTHENLRLNACSAM